MSLVFPGNLSLTDGVETSQTHETRPARLDSRLQQLWGCKPPMMDLSQDRLEMTDISFPASPLLQQTWIIPTVRGCCGYEVCQLPRQIQALRRPQGGLACLGVGRDGWAEGSQKHMPQASFVTAV